MDYTYSLCNKCHKLNRAVLQSDPSHKPVCGNCKSQLPLHGVVNDIDASGLKELVEKSPLPVVADFWAPWCRPCLAFEPSFTEASKDFLGHVIFAKVDTQKNPLAGEVFRIRGVPTLILFQDGAERDRQSGAMPLDVFREWVQSHLRSAAA